MYLFCHFPSFEISWLSLWVLCFESRRSAKCMLVRKCSGVPQKVRQPLAWMKADRVKTHPKYFVFKATHVLQQSKHSVRLATRRPQTSSGIKTQSFGKVWECQVCRWKCLRIIEMWNTFQTLQLKKFGAEVGATSCRGHRSGCSASSSLQLAAACSCLQHFNGSGVPSHGTPVAPQRLTNWWQFCAPSCPWLSWGPSFSCPEHSRTINQHRWRTEALTRPSLAQILPAFPCNGLGNLKKSMIQSGQCIFKALLLGSLFFFVSYIYIYIL